MKAGYFYSSPIGTLKIQLKDDKIFSISKSYRKKPSLKKTKEPQIIQSLRQQLDHYFSKRKINRKNLKWNLPLYPQGTHFQNKVWRCLRAIPYGKTFTYSEIAQKIQHPKAVRAVGSACGKNPWLITTPCHRAVAKNGLGGFALGLKTKQQMLKRESVCL